MVELVFEIDRRKVVVLRMTTLTVVKGFDVLCNPCFRLRPCCKYRAVHELLFERGKKALGYRVIPAVRTPTHATGDVGFLQCFAVPFRRILRTSVAMKDKPIDTRHPMTQGT